MRKKRKSSFKQVTKQITKQIPQQLLQTVSHFESKYNHGQVIAIIDLGSNSIRLMIVSILAGNVPVIVNQVKYMVRLGENSFETKILQEKPMKRTIEVIQAFAQSCKLYHVNEVLARATAAVRNAVNGKSFVQKVLKETGISFEVISGREEARLIYLGVSSDLEHNFGLRFYFDIGGGSTELIVAHSQDSVFLDSLPLGCVLITNLFLNSYTGKIKDSQIKEMQNYIRQESSYFFEKIKSYNLYESVASSGTAQAVYTLSRKLNLGIEENQAEQILTKNNVKEVLKYISNITLEEREKLSGISPQRAEVLVAGTVILLTILEELKIDKILISQLNLQNGVLVDYLQKNSKIPLTQQEKIRKQSIIGLAQAFNYNQKHCEHVNALALMLHDSAVDCGLISHSQKWRALLDYATLVHDIGIAISYPAHNVHSHYIIIHSELVGFTNAEKELIGLLTYFQNKRASKKYSIFNDLDQEIKEKLPIYALFLALAENMDKLNRQHIYEAGFMLEQKEILLYTQQFSSSFIEEHAVRNMQKIIEKVFQKSVKIYFAE